VAQYRLPAGVEHWEPNGFSNWCKDREVDHGEEGKSEEEIREKEEGGSGPREKENTAVEGEENAEEEGGEEGRPHA
jgi:hypothetical protein